MLKLKRPMRNMNYMKLSTSSMPGDISTLKICGYPGDKVKRDHFTNLLSYSIWENSGQCHYLNEKKTIFSEMCTAVGMSGSPLFMKSK